MAFVKIENGVVVQKQYKAREGFMEVPDTVVCGMLHDKGEFSNPPDIEKLQQSKPQINIEEELAKIWDAIETLKS